MLTLNLFDVRRGWAAAELRCAELDAERAAWRQDIGVPQARAIPTAAVPATPAGGRLPAVAGERAPPRRVALIG